MRTSERVGALLGVEVVGSAPLGGGSTGPVAALRLADGRTVVAKVADPPRPGVARAEAHGLRWLAAAGAVAVPAPLAVDDDLLVLEHVVPGSPTAATDEALGTGLAALHRSGAPAFGLDRDNFVGTLPQDNTPAPDWPTFYATRRLEPLTRAAVNRGRLDAATAAAMDRLIAELPRWCGDPEPPARLHGDLWSGNVLVGEGGVPWLIDPAVHGGHREVDLAMMRLFGGFSPAVHAAYEAVHPLADGHAERVGLWQLAPLLVHVVLFGGSYADAVRRTLRRYR